MWSVIPVRSDRQSDRRVFALLISGLLSCFVLYCRSARRSSARTNPEHTTADPNATPITLTPSETQQLTSLAIDLLDKENAMRAWAARHDRNQLPQIVGEYFATAVRVRKALSGLTDTSLR